MNTFLTNTDKGSEIMKVCSTQLQQNVDMKELSHTREAIWNALQERQLHTQMSNLNKMNGSPNITRSSNYLGRVSDFMAEHWCSSPTNLARRSQSTGAAVPTFRTKHSCNFRTSLAGHRPAAIIHRIRGIARPASLGSESHALGLP